MTAPVTSELPRVSVHSSAGEARRALTPRQRFLRRFRRQRAPMIALAVLVLIVAAAVFAPVLAPTDPEKQSLIDAFQGPSTQYWLGTDDLGRDVASRMLYGARISLLAALIGTSVGLFLGVPPGLVAGYFGGRVDATIMLVNDAIMSFPALILAIAITGVLGPSLTNAMFAVGIVMAPRALRLVRGVVLGLREQTFIEASRAIGTRTWVIVVRRILPNAFSAIVVFAATTAGYVMLVEAGLSFLGIGVQPPQASWGSMLGSGYRFISRSSLLVIVPGAAIALTVLCLNLVGDGISDAIGRDTGEGDSA